MSASTWHVREALLLLMGGGFFVHVVSASRQAITAYVTVSLPGHVFVLLSGDTRILDGFPWWFSLAILPVYALVVAHVVTLRPHPGTGVAAADRDATRAAGPVQQPVGAAALPARS